MKRYRIRKGSLADRVKKLGEVIERHEKATIVITGILFWAMIYGAMLSVYPLY